MSAETIAQHTVSSLSIELRVPFGSFWNAVKRDGVLDSCEQDGKNLLITDEKMRELQSAVDIWRQYGISFGKAWQLIRDGRITLTDS